MLREHLLNGIPVSDLCDRYSIHPTLFYRWQKVVFEGMPSLFESRQDSETARLRQQNEGLKDKLANKDTVIAQITKEYVAVKKVLGKLEAFLGRSRDP
ncbi:MAG: transposase [Magnetococcales bacterium]|nr:transposase [Magnetococcales bacterium]